MAPPKTNPADRVSGDGALRRLARRPKQTSLSDNDSQLLAQLETARANLDRLTDQLEIMADWKDDYRKRLARALLRFELIGLDPLDEVMGNGAVALAAEADELVCCFRTLISLRRAAT